MTDKLLIAIPTRKRHDGLKAALESLVNMALPTALAVEILVVENDHQMTIAPIIADFKAFPIHTVLEKNLGLVFVRNRILSEAKRLKADFLAGFDDDETVSNHWLAALWQGINEYNATVVTGPVLSRFEAEPPPWIVKGNFFKTEATRPTGQLMSRAACGNYLLAMDFLKTHPFEFDARFNFIGAEDTDFFGRIAKAVGRIVWIAEAVAYETVPAERLTLRYVLKRDYRIGLGRAVRARKKSLSRALLSGIFGLMTAVFYTIILPFHWTRASFCKRLCKIVKQWAVFSGLFRTKIRAYGSN